MIYFIDRREELDPFEFLKGLLSGEYKIYLTNVRTEENENYIFECEKESEIIYEEI